jgi:hypothetical protein
MTGIRSKRMHGRGLRSAVRGARNLRGFLGIDPAVPPGYENLNYTVRIKGSGTKAEFAEIHAAVTATSPNFYNMSRPVTLRPTLVVE